MELLTKIVDKIKGFTNKSGIYCIKSEDKYYIGSAKSLYSRYKSHFNCLKNNKHQNQKLQNFYNKYGKELLSFYIIEECDNDVLRTREQNYITLVKLVKKYQIYYLMENIIKDLQG